MIIISDERAAHFISERLGVAFCPPYTCMAIEHDGAITGAVLFNHFENFDIHVSVAGAGWTRGFLKAVGDYVFGQLGCERMTAITSSEATATFVERLGGQREGILRSHFGPGRDGFLGGILRHEYAYGNKAPMLRG